MHLISIFIDDMLTFFINNEKALFVHIIKDYGTCIYDLLSKYNNITYTDDNGVFNKELLFDRKMNINILQ